MLPGGAQAVAHMLQTCCTLHCDRHYDVLRRTLRHSASDGHAMGCLHGDQRLLCELQLGKLPGSGVNVTGRAIIAGSASAGNGRRAFEVDGGWHGVEHELHSHTYGTSPHSAGHPPPRAPTQHPCVFPRPGHVLGLRDHF